MGKPKVMVALRDAESIEPLVRLGTDMASLRGTELIVLHVVEVGPGLPLDADGIIDQSGRHILACAQQLAESLGKRTYTLMVRGRQAGPVIVAQAEDHEIDLLIMGYHGSHGLGEILLGSTVKYVGQHAPCRVLVQIPPARERQKVRALTQEPVAVS